MLNSERNARLKEAKRLEIQPPSTGVFHTRQGYVINVPLDHMCLGPDFQRELCKAQVKLIKEGFRWDFFGMPIGIPVGDGFFIVVDGQQRLEGLQARYPTSVDANGKITIGVLVPYGSEAWEIYEGTNRSLYRRNMTNSDCFKARLSGGQPAEIFIFDTLEAKGITLAFTKSTVPPGVCRASAACRTLFVAAASEDNFRQLVEMLRESFSRPDGEVVEVAALTSDFLLGLAKFVKASKHSIEIISYALYWADVSAADIIQRMRLQARKTQNGWARRSGVKQEIKVLVDEYVELYGDLH